MRWPLRVRDRWVGPTAMLLPSNSLLRFCTRVCVYVCRPFVFFLCVWLHPAFRTLFQGPTPAFPVDVGEFGDLSELLPPAETKVQVYVCHPSPPLPPVPSFSLPWLLWFSVLPCAWCVCSISWQDTRARLFLLLVALWRPENAYHGVATDSTPPTHAALTITREHF